MATATIFDYIEGLKKFYDDKNSFTKGILIDNINNEIKLIKTSDSTLANDLHKLDLKLIKKYENKIIFNGNYFTLTIQEYNGNYNEFSNNINLNMINKHYLFYNNHGFNSGIIGTALNLDVPGKKLYDFKKSNNIKNFIKDDKMYSIQITENFHKTVDINKLDKNDKINVFIQLLHNIKNYYSGYDNLILNIQNLDQFKVYKLDKEITYVFNNTKKYKSKYIIKITDLSTSQIHPKLKNDMINIDKNQDLKNLIKLFDISEYKNFSDINSILDDYLKYDFEDTEMTELSRTYFRNISDDVTSSEQVENKLEIYKKPSKQKRRKKEKKKNSKKKTSKKVTKKNSKKKTSKKVTKKNSKKLTEITGKRLIGGKKTSKKKTSKKKTSKKKASKKKTKRSKKKRHNKKNIDNSSNDDFSLEDSDDKKFENDDEFSLDNSDNKKHKNIDNFLNDDFSL